MILWFSVFFFLSDLPLWVTAGLGMNNVMYHYIRESVNHLIIIGIYYFIINSPWKKKVILFLLITVSVIGIASLLYFKDPPGQVTSIYKLGIIFVVFMHFHTIMSEINVKNILNYPFFWISSGILIYSCGSILIFLFYNYVFYTPTFYYLYMSFLDFLVITMFAFIGIGFLNSKNPAE